MKPGYACIKAIRTYFASLPRPIHDRELIIVGDRIFTDVVLANRMSKYRWLSDSSSLRDSVEKIESTARLIDSKGASKRLEKDGPLSIFVENIWKRESTMMRFLEKKLAQTVRNWNTSLLDYSRELGNKGFVRIKF